MAFTWGYTGSMRDQLAEWYDWVAFDGNLGDCQRGGILLRETEGTPAAHTCMVTETGTSVIEASWDWDGQTGDSSGTEVYEHGIYDDQWEWFGIPKDGLDIDAGIAWARAWAADDSHGYSQADRWDNEADCSSYVLRIVNHMISGDSGSDSGGTNTSTQANLPVPRYRVWNREHGQCDWMLGLAAEDGSGGDDFAGYAGEWIYDVEIDPASLGGGWWKLILLDGTELPVNTGNDAREQPVRGVVVYYMTPDPDTTGYYKAQYRVSPSGGDYLKWEFDDEDGGAGDDESPIDRLQLTICKV